MFKILHLIIWLPVVIIAIICLPLVIILSVGLSSSYEEWKAFMRDYIMEFMLGDF